MKTIHTTLLLTLCVLGFLCFLGTQHAAAVEILLLNADDDGEGFNDPTPVAPVGNNTGQTLGEQRQLAFQFAAGIWAELLQGDQEIVIEANFEIFTGPLIFALGFAGPSTFFRDFTNAPFEGTWYSIANANNIAGEDLSPEIPDISTSFNSLLDFQVSPFKWYYGLDGNPPPGTFDIVEVLLHEFAHGLGFLTLNNGNTGEFLGDLPDVYSHFILDQTTGQHWSEMTNGERVDSATRANQIVWDGDSVNNALPNVLDSRRVLTTESPSGNISTFQVLTDLVGPTLTIEGVTGILELAQDSSSTSTVGCEPFTGFTPGNIAIFDRGNCLVSQKIQNAQDAGAIAAVLVDNGQTGIQDILDIIAGTQNTISIPFALVSLEEGIQIKEMMQFGETIATLELNESFLAGADDEDKALLFAPNPFRPGSSISHWDTRVFPNLLMEPADTLNSYDVDITLNLLQDIGWNTILSQSSFVQQWYQYR